MDWISAALITFSATAANHLGLVRGVEKAVRHRLPVVDCPKCLTFWGVLAYGGLSGDGTAALPSALPGLLATSFLCSYLALWIDLLMYAIDTLYNRIYGTIEEYNNEEEGGGEDAEEYR